MASNLLTALQKIENGRKGIIKTLKNLNYPISEEASFNKINDILKTNNIEGAPYKNYYVDYYSNPFEDPSIFKKPTNIPDVESILYNAPTIQYNNTSTICYPARMILIDDALAKIYIATSSMIGTGIGSTSMRFGYGTGWSVVTSDGAQYDMTANNLSYGHTWDTTKDIVMPDGKRYRWLMAYAPVSTTTGLSYMVNGGVGSKVNVVAGAVCAAMGYSTSHPAIGNDSISKLAEYVVYIKDTLNSSGRTSYSLPLICGKYIDIKIGENTSAGMPSDSSCFPGAKTIINDSISIGEKISLQASVTYFRSPTYGFKVVVSGSTASYSSLAPYGHPIKYLEITNKEAQSKLNLTPTYLHFPNLLNTDCLIGIGSISSTGLFARTLENIKTLELPSVTSIVDDAFSGCSHKDVLSLPGMTSINVNTLRGANFTTIKLPNVNVLSVTPLMHPGVRELDLSGATQISSLIVSSNTEFSPQLMSIDISNATSISSSAFNYAFYLQNLKIKEGYVGELNLGKCPNLDITSVKEIFNNLGETETEYTITLASCVYYKLTAEELAIATNKGYVLKSNYSF